MPGRRRGPDRIVVKAPTQFPEPVTVDQMHLDGWGVARHGDQRLRIDQALSGERVLFHQKRRRRGRVEGVIERLIDASPNRVDARCPYFGVCGGCSLQHVAPAYQLEMKQAALIEHLKDSGVTSNRVLSPVTGPEWGYRRRARLGARYVSGKGRVLVGFRERFKSYVTDMDSCEVMVPEASALIRPLADLILGLSLFQRLPQIEITVADNQTALVFRILDTPSDADTAALKSFGQQHGVTIYLQSGGIDSVKPLSPPVPSLRFRLEKSDLTFEFGPTEFIQVNSAINEKLIDRVLKLLRPETTDAVLDLFCGIGNITLPLGRTGAKVTGIESNPTALKLARTNARLNKLDNVCFFESDLTDGLEKFFSTQSHVDLVVLDPPRTGAEVVSRQLGSLSPRRIVYISCHAPSLARDAGILGTDSGYRLEAVGVMDMFPHTSHVESIALFEKD